MTESPLRVAFAGLAHSHPHADAGNVLSLGAEIVGVYDVDTRASLAFASRFGGSNVPSVEGLTRLQPDIVIATPRPDEVTSVLRALGAVGATAPVFVNKVIAASMRDFAAVDRAITAAAVPVGTSSVLRFAPALTALAAEVVAEHVLGVRVYAQHDNAAFQQPGRDWQDDPVLGGGTLVTVGVHAWEMVDTLLPGADLTGGSGWTRRGGGVSATRSEDAAGIDGVLRLGGGLQDIPVQVLVTGVPGADAYAVELVTTDGILSVALDTEEPNISLGFEGLIRALLADGASARVVAPWSQARMVVSNTIRAAEIARTAAPGLN
ncbi:hypothetical protein LTA6_001043 [Microbacterium sp. LTA6]|uniref:hypothetical protein n=1 Tax=unclassified Microbacterium TaxID=2609290 RepID=UPI0031391A3A